MRHGLRDVKAARQRSLFGVDKLERLLFDVCTELVRHHDKLGVDPNPHMMRIRAELLEYADRQRSDFELGEVSDGSTNSAK